MTLLNADPKIAEYAAELAAGRLNPNDRIVLRTTSDQDRAGWTDPDGTWNECDLRAECFEITHLVHAHERASRA